MRSRFPKLRRLTLRLFEVFGAALASVAAAFLLGGLGGLNSPQITTPVLVQIRPADEELARLVRSQPDNVSETSRTADTPAVAAPAMPVAAETRKPAKSAPGSSRRREQRAAAAPALVDTPRPDALPQGQPSDSPFARADAASKSSRSAAAPDTRTMPAATAEGAEEDGLFSVFRQTGSWLPWSGERPLVYVPRPPMPVGQFWHGAF